MTRLGIVVSDTWHFFRDIADYLETQFEVSTFREVTYKLPFLGTKINNWRLRHDLSRIMSSVDVAFFEWASVYLIPASHLRKSCKIIARLHHYELYHWSHLVNWSNVDRIILVSTGIQRAFAERFPDHAHKTVVVPGGIRLDRFAPTQRPFRGNLGTLCHLTPRKRVYELILALYPLLCSDNSLSLHIGGDELPEQGDYYRAMHVLVEKLNLHDRVFFDGLVSDTPAWYRKIDTFISNSYSEGLQVAPMEAIASGCYTLSHAWEGVEDMLADEFIYITDEELRHKVVSYLGAAEDDRSILRTRQYADIADLCDVRKVQKQISEVIREVGSS